MANLKGTSVVSLREIVIARGQQLEKDLLARLTPDQEKLYKNALAITWTPIEKQVALYEIAAPLLFPNDPNPMRELGKAMAGKNYGGIYRFFLRIPTVEYIMGQVARMWRTYYDQGEASIEKLAERSLQVVVRNIPELSANLRELIGGNFTVVMEYTGAKNVRVAAQGENPEAWRWLIQWD